MNFHEEHSSFSQFFDPNRRMYERIVPIMEAIIEDANLEEPAVNVPNENFIGSLPNGIVVEVPGKVNRLGVNGIGLENYPQSFGLLLNNQTGVIQLTTEAVLKKSKHSAYLALLADPVIDNSINAQNLLNTMLEVQDRFLGYLK